MVCVIAVGAISYAVIRKANNAKKVTVSDLPTIKQDSSSSAEEETGAEYTLSIEKIGIEAPLVLNVDGNDKDAYIKSLEDGVAHLKYSALPGASGNTVIFGHSSYYANKPGNYKKIFATLNDLNIDDRIEIKSTSKTYTYKIVDKLVVKPEETSVVSQDLSKSELTLLTCWPINSTAKRLVIKAILAE